MPTLTVPTVSVHRSFLAAWDELGPGEEHWMGIHTYGDGDQEWTREQAADPAEFARLVEALAAGRPGGAPPPGRGARGGRPGGDRAAAGHRAPDHALVRRGRRVVRPAGDPAPAHPGADRARRSHRVRRPSVGPPPWVRDPDARPVPSRRRRARDRPGAGDLRRRQRRIPQGDRVGRRRTGRRTTRKAEVLGADTRRVMTYRRAHEGRHPDA